MMGGEGEGAGTARGLFHGLYALAGVRIAVTSQYESVHRLLRDYAAEGEADFSVFTSQEDIAWEQEKSDREAALEGVPAKSWDVTYLEELAVYRKIAEELPFYDAMLIHGSALSVEGRAFLFCAKSGTGKSTHTRLWRRVLKDRVQIINDDKPLLRIREEGPALCYGTPYDGKHHLSNPIQADLEAIAFIERSPVNKTLPISPREAFPLLLQQVYHPGNQAAMAKTLCLLGRLSAHTRFYKVLCNQEEEAALTACRAMGVNNG